MRKEDFYTRIKSENGVEVPLKRADGSDSDEWLRVYGPDSKPYAQAMATFQAAHAAAKTIEDPNEQDVALEKLLLDLRTALVCGWSFQEPFTEPALREFLTNAPRAANQIELAASDLSRFFGLDSTDSTPGPQSSETSQAVTEPSSPNASVSQ